MEGEKPQTKEAFMGRHKKATMELTTELLYLELTTCFSLLCSKEIYALRKISSY